MGWVTEGKGPEGTGRDRKGPEGIGGYNIYQVPGIGNGINQGNALVERRHRHRHLPPPPPLLPPLAQPPLQTLATDAVRLPTAASLRRNNLPSPIVYQVTNVYLVCIYIYVYFNSGSSYVQIREQSSGKILRSIAYIYKARGIKKNTSKYCIYEARGILTLQEIR